MSVPLRAWLPPQDEEAFRTMYSANHLLVRRVLFNLTGRQALEDLTQEVFLRAWKGLPRFGFRSSARTWIYRITVNVAIDHLRRNPWRALSVGNVEEYLDPASQEDSSADRRAVVEALATLDEVHRTTVVLHYFEDLSIDEIAKVLEVPVGTIKSRLHHGRAKLRQVLLAKGVEV